MQFVISWRVCPFSLSNHNLKSNVGCTLDNYHYPRYKLPDKCSKKDKAKLLRWILCSTRKITIAIYIYFWFIRSPCWFLRFLIRYHQQGSSSLLSQCPFGCPKGLWIFHSVPLLLNIGDLFPFFFLDWL